MTITTGNTQDPPFAVQIEPTEGCTLACSFCALQSIRDNGADAEAGVHGDGKGPYRFMDVDTAYRIAFEIKRLEWNPRIEFAMHGEPTLHPDLPRIISYFRDISPKLSIMVTTNGSGIMKPERMLKLFDAGVNTIAIDNYKHANFVERIREWMTARFCLENSIAPFKYPRDKDGNPHHRYAGKRVVIISDISENTQGTHKLTNQGGNSFKSTGPIMQKRCAKPFRELSVRWDGNVALCCDDWPGEFKVGNVNTMALDTIWNHERMRAARRALYHGRRDLIPVCARCDVVTYRNGLLPDHMGRLTMPKPSGKDMEHIMGAHKGRSFTSRVKK